MLNQRLEQKLLQKLSPQQIQLMKLLQIPTIALEQRIKQEIEENPALEEAADDEYDEEKTISDQDDEDAEFQDDQSNDEFDLSDYLDEDDTPSYKLNTPSGSSDDENRQIPFAAGTSFHEQLKVQLGYRKLDEKQYNIGLAIIGNLDENGYLSRDPASLVDDLLFSQNIQASIEDIQEVLEIIQEFDPPGVGARNLKECLLIQLRRQEKQTSYTELAINILERFFNEFSKKHYQKIISRSGAPANDIKEAIDEILKLNPKPGNSLSDSSKGAEHIIPDFMVTNNEGELEVIVNSRQIPELRVNRSYVDMLEAFVLDKKNEKKNRDTIVFVKQKIDSAKWFIDAIRQRQNTLDLTMNSIVDYQKEFFLTGDETKLKPMILKDIADRVNLDISTISRVANSKYVQTPFGTFLLKSFFSESLSTESGEEVSTREVKKILTEFIEQENKSKPLTDEKLALILREKGYNIARRTVAKYREQLGIPVARMRKEL